jgi:hypothetical protein
MNPAIATERRVGDSRPGGDNGSRSFTVGRS